MLDRSTAAWLALILGLLLTAVLWRYVDAHLEERTRDRFTTHATLARDNLLSRVQAYEQVLHGGAALFAASDHVGRSEWAAYVAALHLERSLPGIQGTGFTLMLLPAQLEAHVAAVRAEGFPDYTVHPPGYRDRYSSIVFLEPFDGRNRRAFGYDMYSEPVRREAMERARDTGVAALSGRVTLVQEFGTEVQPGFLIYLPVYAKAMPVASVEQRRAALLGYVYAPFRAYDMMQAIFRADLPTQLVAITSLLRHHPDPAFVQTMLMRLLSYVMQASDAVTREQASAALEAAEPQQGASIMPTLAQQWLDEGRVEGRTEGLQEGQVQGTLTGIEVALDLKFGAAGLALLPEIRTIQDVVLLRSVLSAIRGAASVDELRAVYRVAS
ncbi:MAG: CHASE domain-containing protein [Proteobacteria bacterium]|nr:CHASE domain-containing protein [Pseudomonadota bacterium]